MDIALENVKHFKDAAFEHVGKNQVSVQNFGTWQKYRRIELKHSSNFLCLS